MKLNIAIDYSPFTGLRHSSNSDLSGEDFYHNKLNEVFATAIQNKDNLELILDGSLDGYAPSFLDEAIGNLVYDFGLDIVRQKLIIISERESQWKTMIETQTYPNWAERLKEGKAPIVTQSHEAWFRLRDNKLEKRVWEVVNK